MESEIYSKLRDEFKELSEKAHREFHELQAEDATNEELFQKFGEYLAYAKCSMMLVDKYHEAKIKEQLGGNTWQAQNSEDSKRVRPTEKNTAQISTRK
jgi:hypothetical protein